MYKCNHCGRYFEEPFIGEMELETGYTPSGCPYCGEEDDYEDAGTCQKCGEPVDWDEDFCEDCVAEITEEMNKLKEKLELDEDAWYNAMVMYIEAQ